MLIVLILGGSLVLVSLYFILLDIVIVKIEKSNNERNDK